MYERRIYSQSYDCFDKNIFSKYKCGFVKGFSTQHALLVIIEKMKTIRDNKEFCTAILTDLSKDFGCICHDFLTVKINTYRFEAYL